MSLYPDHVIAEVNATLDIRALLDMIDYKSNKLQDSGDTIRGFCPIHRESVFRTLVIDKNQRTFRCMYGLCEGSRGGHLVNLFALARKISTDDAAGEIIDAQRLKISTPVDPALLIRNVEVADNFLSLGQLDAAEQLYQQILSMRSDLIRAHEGLLELARRRGDEAMEVDRLGALAQAHLKSGRPEQALVYAGQWESLRPEDAQVKRLRAECALAGGLVLDALFAFLEVADASESANLLDGALEAYARAERLQLDHDLDEVDVLPHILRLLEALGRGAEAVSYLVTRAERMATQNQLERAASLYAEAIAHQPDDLHLHQRFTEIFVQAPLVEDLVGQFFASLDVFKSREMFEEAIQALQTFNERNPGHGLGLQRLADLLYADGRNAEGGNVEAVLASMAMENGRAIEGKDRLARVLEWQPEHPGCLRMLATIEDHLQDRTAAVNARRRLAKSLLQRRDFEGALEAIEAALATDPTSAELQEQRASTLETMGHVLQRRDALREAAAIYSALASGNSGSLGENTDRVREMRLLERAVGADPNPSVELMLRLARSYLANSNKPLSRDTAIRACEALAAAGDYAQSIETIQQFAALIPSDNDLVFYHAELLLRMGDAAGAGRCLRKLARQRAIEGQPDMAEEIFDQALRITPDESGVIDDLADIFRESGDEDRRLKALLRAASVHESRADLQAAIRTLSQLLELVPDDIATIQRIIDHAERLKRTDLGNEWRVRLAAAYRAAGDRDREARVLREVLQKDPDQEGALRLLIHADLDRGDGAAAIRSARRLAATQVEDKRPADALATLMVVVERLPDIMELQVEAFKMARLAGDGKAALRLGSALARWHEEGARLSEALLVVRQQQEVAGDRPDLLSEEIRLLERSGQVDGLDSARLRLARCLEKAEDFPAAEAQLQRLIEERPGFLEAREALIDLYGRLGNSAAMEAQLALLAAQLQESGAQDGGVAALRRILRISPENLPVRRQLIDCLVQIGTAEATAAAVEELHKLADVLRGQDNETEALLAERLAADAQPEDPAPRRRLAESYVALDRLSAAAEELVRIAEIHRNGNRVRDALTVLEECIALDPGCAPARRMRAEILSEPGEFHDPAAALEDYKAASDVGSSGRLQAVPESVVFTGGLAVVSEYVFDTFVVGPGNRFAHATCLAIARNPAKAYNPMFLHAGVGLGKTHLVNAIANHVALADPSARIIYTSAEDFAGELVGAIRSNSAESLLARYKKADLLLLEDVQFLAGRERAQEEFFHIFNALQQAGRQIVLTSDRPPASLETLESRLRGRFGAGVIVDIQPPDLETRSAILANMAAVADLPLDSWAIDQIARRIESNVRDLRGVINQLRARRDLEGIDLTPEAIESILSRILPVGTA